MFYQRGDPVPYPTLPDPTLPHPTRPCPTLPYPTDKGSKPELGTCRLRRGGGLYCAGRLLNVIRRPEAFCYACCESFTLRENAWKELTLTFARRTPEVHGCLDKTLSPPPYLSPSENLHVRNSFTWCSTACIRPASDQWSQHTAAMDILAHAESRIRSMWQTCLRGGGRSRCCF